VEVKTMLPTVRETNTDERPPADDRLDALLSQWRAIEPAADFEAGVWRRIRSAAAAEPHGLTLIDIMRDWIVPQPAWSSAIAAAAAILIGIWAGSSAPSARAGRQAAEPLLQAQTLAGSYLTMVTGETR
jgi:hypothetical protein